jgi:4-amino-4-deoxy-L-arabinose transferase-like glycosyltransferase
VQEVAGSNPVAPTNLLNHMHPQFPRSEKPLNFFQISILVVLTFFAFFYGMASYPIVDMNEGLYAEVAREMLQTGNYFIPHLNYVEYLEKPPLLYWLIALSYHLFGINTFAARLIPSLSAASVSVAIIFFTQKINRVQLGWLTCIILTSSFVYAVIGRVVFFDMLLTAVFTIALCLFYLWYHTEKNTYLYFSYIAIGFAFLAKGLIGVLLASAIAMIYLFLSRTPIKKIVKFFNPVGIVLFFLITLPWPILASIQSPTFAWDYFINEQWYRFLNKRIPHDYHTGPIYYYVPRVIAYLFPWSVLLPTLVAKFKISTDPLRVFLWIWFLLPLLFFSISGEKGDYYMVIAMPALAMLIAMKIQDFQQKNKYLLLSWIFIIVTTALLIAGIDVLYIHPLFSDSSFLKLLFFVIFFYFLLGSFILWRYKNPTYNFLLIAGLIIPIMIGFVNVEIKTTNIHSQISLINYIQSHDSQRTVYLYQDYETLSSALFFLERRIPIIDSVSQDLFHGQHTKAGEGWFITLPQFVVIEKNKPVYVILLKNKLNNFIALTKPQFFHIVASSGKAVLLSNISS